MNIYKGQFVERHDMLATDLVYKNTTFTGTDQVGKLCRVLGSGVLEIYRGDRLDATVKNIANRAKYRLLERKSPKLGNHIFETVEYHPQ